VIAAIASSSRAISLGSGPARNGLQSVAFRLFPSWEHARLNLAVRIISRKALRDFAAKHPRAEGPLNEWFAFVSRANWKTPADVKRDFAAASFVSPNRIVFNVASNHYRIVVVALLNMGTLYIRFVGTHSQYDRIDVSEV
jgi:mRNA interferase HigB